MRLDHIAYRVARNKRDEAMRFFIEAFGYKFQEEFPIYFDDAKKDMALCVALEPPEKATPDMPWIQHGMSGAEYHLAPEIFISEGTPGSIVDEWVQSRSGIGGVHHIAYQCEDVDAKMAEWTKMGYANFSSAKPIICVGEDGAKLTQVFSKPNCTGVIYEFIKREGRGFCASNVKALMLASKGD